jgi:hypothetical protein
MLFDFLKDIIYRNGVLRGSFTSQTLANNSTNFHIAGTGGVFANNLTGSIDEVGIWSRALSSTEVTALYNSGNGFQYPFSTSSIKSINGLAKASIKSINGLAIASVKSVNGLA